MNKKIYLLLLPQIFSFGLIQAQPKSTQKAYLVENSLRPSASFVFADSSLKQYNIIERMNYYNVPSVSIAVINAGKLEWAKAYGFANDSLKTPADTHTLYQAASISKSINALCILKLVQEGKLSLSKDIRGYLKTWNFPDNEFSKNTPITLENLLSHTAGLSTSGFIGYKKGDALPQINQMLDGTPPSNSDAVKPILKPGTRWLYSGGGTLITKKILLDNIAPNYAELLKQMVLNPLKMKSSTFEQPLPAKYKNFATAYNSKRKAIAGDYNIYPEQAPDGLWTTPSDYARFILSIQSSLTGKKGLLSNAMAHTMLKPVLATSSAGLGVNVKEVGGEKYFFHSGTNIGYQSVYYGSANSGNGVVILINSDNAAILDEIVNSVAIAYNWKEFYNPEVRRLILIPDSLSNNFTGEFKSNQPVLNIRIRKKNGGLELTTKGDNRFEKMYFISSTEFFLKSSPDNKATFLKTDDSKIYLLQIKQGDQVLFTAVKQ